jgi:hypothetical protein
MAIVVACFLVKFRLDVRHVSCKSLQRAPFPMPSVNAGVFGLYIKDWKQLAEEPAVT